jgi:hypothetical protein
MRREDNSRDPNWSSGRGDAPGDLIASPSRRYAALGFAQKVRQGGVFPVLTFCLTII